MNFLQNYRQKFQGTWQHTLRSKLRSLEADLGFLKLSDALPFGFLSAECEVRVNFEE